MKRKFVFIGLLMLSLEFLLLAPSAQAANATVYVGGPLGEYTVCGPNVFCIILPGLPPPSDANINAGDFVQWIWQGNNHSVTSEASFGSLAPAACGTGDVLNSGIQSIGADFAHTFNNPGTCYYFCIIHPNAQAQVMVGPGSTTTTSTTTTTRLTTTTTTSTTTTTPTNTTTTITTTTTTTTSTTTTTTCNDQNNGQGKDKGKGHNKGRCKGHDKSKA